MTMNYFVKNNDMSHPLQFRFDDGIIVGQFYLAVDKRIHLIEYIPYSGPPRTAPCGAFGAFSPSRDANTNRHCPQCQALLDEKIRA
jgi:hypothetical protein